MTAAAETGSKWRGRLRVLLYGAFFVLGTMADQLIPYASIGMDRVVNSAFSCDRRYFALVGSAQEMQRQGQASLADVEVLADKFQLYSATCGSLLSNEAMGTQFSLDRMLVDRRDDYFFNERLCYGFLVQLTSTDATRWTELITKNQAVWDRCQGDELPIARTASQF